MKGVGGGKEIPRDAGCGNEGPFCSASRAIADCSTKQEVGRNIYSLAVLTHSQQSEVIMTVLKQLEFRSCVKVEVAVLGSPS